MIKQHTSFQTLKSVAGSALAGHGLFILFTNVDRAATQLRHVFNTPGEGLGLLSSVILAASFDHQRLLHGLLHMLVLFWPLFFVITGGILLRTAFTKESTLIEHVQKKIPSLSN